MFHLRKFVPLVSLAALFLSSGCGVLFGNVKPVTEKSQGYDILTLSDVDSDWEKLKSEDVLDSESKKEIEESDEDEKDERQAFSSDAAYQSKSSGSIISINSACRSRIALDEETLRQFTDSLFLGFTDIRERDEKATKVSGSPALQTTISANINNEPMKIRAVVLKQETCVYDLMYLARPKNFEKNEKLFTKFVDSLHIN